MRIRITAPGIFGAITDENPTGQIAVGTEFDVKEEPTGWAGRYDVIGTSEGKTAVTNPGKELEKLNVEELKKHLTDKGVSFPDNATKADLVALAKA